MRPKVFLISCIPIFFLLAFCYAALVDGVFRAQQKPPFYITQLLLEATSDIGGKVVIDGGSNVIHGIDTLELSEQLHVPVIIVADNASYPVRNKIYNLLRYLHPGDTLILPLEWNRYSEDDLLSTAFLSQLTDKNYSLGYYYHVLPPTEKLRFIFTQLPLPVFILSLLESRDSEIQKTAIQERLVYLEGIVSNFDNESFGGSLRDGPEDMHPGAAALNCGQYVSPRTGGAGEYLISDVFLRNLELLRAVSDAGVRVLFSWPAMVDSDFSRCLAGRNYRKKLGAYAERITELVESNGFEMIGDYRDYHFTAECMLDTYYHLRYRCAGARTDSLVKALDAAAVEFKPSEISQEMMRDSVLRWIEDRKQEVARDGLNSG